MEIQAAFRVIKYFKEFIKNPYYVAFFQDTPPFYDLCLILNESSSLLETELTLSSHPHVLFHSKGFNNVKLFFSLFPETEIDLGNLFCGQIKQVPDSNFC